MNPRKDSLIGAVVIGPHLFCQSHTKDATTAASSHMLCSPCSVLPSSGLNPTGNTTRRNPNSRSQTLLPSINLILMDVYVDLCCSFGLPVWIASLFHAAKHLRTDCARRKKVYRLLQRKLMFHRVGVKEGNLCQPTYVYPDEVKMLIRSVFSQNICDYPNPCHDQVVYVTVEDLHKVGIN